MLQFGAPPSMKMWEGEPPCEPLIVPNSALGDNPLDCPMARPPKTRNFMGVLHEIFNFTTADENGGLGGSVGADLRAATSLNRKVAAQERCSHIETAFS